MNVKPAIIVNDVSKSYNVYKRAQDFIWELFTNKSYHDVFWALRNVTFEVSEKQRLGIIGPNGAGKSTLLKILTGNLTPSSGSVKINGKVSALLSMASSLNPEESGYDNIKFNLMLNGVPREQMSHLIEDIVEFTELASFIYSPVKTYSSGMNARLSFAIATAMEPEILVIDEVLSVGDGYFLGKAYARMMNLVGRGKALIFVSHSVADVRKICSTALWLEDGSVRLYGEAGYVCSKYEEDYQQKRIDNERAGNIEKNRSRIFNIGSDEVDLPGLYRLRIIPDGSKSHSNEYYVRNISLEDLSGSYSIPLEMTETVGPSTFAYLDIAGSQWGRIYTKGDELARIITPKSRIKKGGQIILNPIINHVSGDSWTFRLMFDHLSSTSCGSLTVELLDFISVGWIPCPVISTVKQSDGWCRTEVECTLPLVDQDVYAKAIDKIQKQEKSDIEILYANLIVNNSKATTAVERQSFAIEVILKVNNDIPIADVQIIMYRSDGVYVFWQSSGMTDGNIIHPTGYQSITFHFDDNCFCAGKYYINVVCSNGWDVETNFPHTHIYDYKQELLEFSIIREYDIPNMDFGQVNKRVPVTVKEIHPDKE